MQGWVAVPPPKAVVVAVGDELLYGHTVNSNGAWLGQELFTLGVRWPNRRWWGTREDRSRGLGKATRARDVVMLTGGLGPTPDDSPGRPSRSYLGFRFTPVRSLPGRELRSGSALVGIATSRESVADGGGPPRRWPMPPELPGRCAGLSAWLPGRRRFCVLLPGIPGEMRVVFTGSCAHSFWTDSRVRLLPVFHRSIHTHRSPGVGPPRPGRRGVSPRGPAPGNVAYLPHAQGG